MATLTPAQIAAYPESKQHAIVGSLVVFLILVNFSAAFRVYAQLKISKRVFAEDYLIILAAMFASAVMATYLAATTNGLGLHLFRIIADNLNHPQDPPGIVTFFLTLFVPATLNGPFFLSVKLSLLFFYRRIFLVNQKWLRIFWWINLVYAVLWFFGSTLYYIFQCNPVSYYWVRMYSRVHAKPPYSGGECTATTVGHVAIPLILSLISDFALLLLPTFALSKLQISIRRKVALLALFSLGLLACVLELVRIVILEIDTDDSVDSSYDTVTFVILTCAEESVAVMCACLPVIASQMRLYIGKVRSSKQSSDRSGLTGQIIRLSDQKWRDGSSSGQDVSPSQEHLHSGPQTSTKVSCDTDDTVYGGANNQIQVRREVDLSTV